MPRFKVLQVLALLAYAIFHSAAIAECVYPRSPSLIPDGSSATLEQMLRSQRAVKEFDAGITAYQLCIEEEVNAAIKADPTLTENQKTDRLRVLAQKQNAAVDEAQALADRLNAQIRIFKERNSASSRTGDAAATASVNDVKNEVAKEQAKTSAVLAAAQEEQRRAKEIRDLAEKLEAARNERLAAEAALAKSQKERAEAERVQSGAAESPKLSSGKRIALVIGNADYRSQPLTNPTNDSADIAKTLRSRGFKVIERTNASLVEMRRAAREFSDELVSSDAALFYFAGHGVEVNGRNYLVPVGADIEKEFEVADQAYDATQITEMMQSIPSASGQRVNIVIVDACRNNPLTRSWRSAGKGLAKMDAPTGTIIAFSTAPGRIAADGQGRNSPFTKHLLRAIQKPDQPIEQVFKSVRRAVLEETNGAQTPWENSSLVGDFYFTPTR